MKYATKLTVVPYDPKQFDNPLESRLSNLDSEMSSIFSNQQLNMDEKIKNYNQILSKFILLHNPKAFADTSILNDLKNKRDLKENDLLSIKNEPKIEEKTPILNKSFSNLMKEHEQSKLNEISSIQNILESIYSLLGNNANIRSKSILTKSKKKATNIRFSDQKNIEKNIEGEKNIEKNIEGEYEVTDEEENFQTPSENIKISKTPLSKKKINQIRKNKDLNTVKDTLILTESRIKKKPDLFAKNAWDESIDFF